MGSQEADDIAKRTLSRRAESATSLLRRRMRGRKLTAGSAGRLIPNSGVRSSASTAASRATGLRTAGPNIPNRLLPTFGLLLSRGNLFLQHRGGSRPQE